MVRGGSGSDPARSAAGKASLPLAAAVHFGELLGRLLDGDLMLDVFRRELPRISSVPLEVTACKVKASRGRSALRDGRLNVIYKLRIRAEGGSDRECALLGTAPETAAFLAGDGCASLRGHPALEPFHEPALVLDDLQLALCIFPLDPGLPALAELTGTHGAGQIGRAHV